MFTAISLIVTLLAICGLTASAVSSNSDRIVNMKSLHLGKTILSCAILVVIIFLCTTPYIPPFSAGMRLGYGFLIGGAAGIIALIEAAGNVANTGWVRRAVAMISLAILATVPVIYFFKGDPADVLTGVAISAVLVSVIGMISYRLADNSIIDNIAGVNWMTLFIFAVSIAAIGSRLAIMFPFKGDSVALHAAYWLIPQVVLSVMIVVFSLLVKTGIDNFKIKNSLLINLTTVLLSSLILFVMNKFLLPEVNFIPVVIGGVSFIFITLMLHLYKDADNIPISLLIISGFFIIAISAISLRYMGGLGLMIAAATALSVIVLPALANSKNRISSEILFSLTGLLLFMGLERFLYYQTHGKMVLDFQIQYNQIAIIIGLGVVWVTMKIINGVLVRNDVKAWKLWVKAAMLIFVMIILPPIAYSLWSISGLWACLTGMLLSGIGWLFVIQMNTGEAREKNLLFSPVPIIILIVLSSAQIIPLFIDKHIIITRSIAHIGALVLFIPVIITFIIEAINRKEQGNA